MGSYNHDFVSFRRWFFSVISISYGKYGFLSTSHIIKTLSFPVVVVVVAVVVCACVRLLSLISNCDCDARALRVSSQHNRNWKRFHRLYSVHSSIAASQRHRNRSWKLSFSDDVTKL
jgi:hypothetical protein